MSILTNLRPHVTPARRRSLAAFALLAPAPPARSSRSPSASRPAREPPREG